MLIGPCTALKAAVRWSIVVGPILAVRGPEANNLSPLSPSWNTKCCSSEACWMQ